MEAAACNRQLHFESCYYNNLNEIFPASLRSLQVSNDSLYLYPPLSCHLAIGSLCSAPAVLGKAPASQNSLKGKKDGKMGAKGIQRLRGGEIRTSPPARKGGYRST